MPLKRSLTAIHVVGLGIGAIIGAGIFVLTGHAAAANAGPAITLSFLLGAVVCGCAGLCYAEMASTVPVAGSAYTYAYATLGELVAWIIGWDLILEYALGATTVAIGWSGYVVSFLKDFGIVVPPDFAGSPLDYDAAQHAWHFTGAVINAPAMVVIAVMTDAPGRRRPRIRARQQCHRRHQARHHRAVHRRSRAACLDRALGDGEKPGRRFHSAQSRPRRSSAGAACCAAPPWCSSPISALTRCRPRRRKPRIRSATCRSAFSVRSLICTVLYLAVGFVLTGIVAYDKLNVADPIAVGIDAIGLTWLSPLLKFGIILGLTSVILVGHAGPAAHSLCHGA